MTKDQGRQRAAAPFSGRAAAVFGVTLSFVTMVLSGLAMFLAPHCHVLHRVDWTFCGVSRDGWAAIHLATSVLFSAFVLWHFLVHVSIYRGLLLGSPSRRGHRIEAGFAIVAVLFVAVAAVLDLPPISWLSDLGDWFKQEDWIR